ncbi:hypothetical protein FB451DRAFT_1266123 [Mycena latifolia]|nr:hypothetical protein FB451DRAFT_1266123 [Mycena latifolia]
MVTDDSTTGFRELTPNISADKSMLANTSQPSRAVRDEKFYFPSGDCILQVEHTLFKIHKFHLVTGSPVFAGMFALPLCGAAGEGLSDDLPIVLEGDTVFDFRSLLKYIYASVIDTQIMLVPPSQLPHIVAVARLAHKYELAPWQRWAFLVAASHFKNDIAAKKLSVQDLAMIYGLCHRDKSWDSLRDEIVDKWIQRITDPGDLAVAGALDTAELHGDHAFLTRLYCLHLKHMSEHSSLFDPKPLRTDGISPFHMQRMLAGYWSLSAAWDQFRRTPIPLPRIPTIHQLLDNSVSHRTGCTPRFRSHWDKAVSEAEQADLVLDISSRLHRVAVYLTAALTAEIENGTFMCLGEFVSSGGLAQAFANDVRVQDHFFPPEAVSNSEVRRD